MDELQIKEVTRHLKEVVTRARREAIVCSLLAVLCTPLFVAMVSVAVGAMLFHDARKLYYGVDIPSAICTGTIFFLGFMLVFALMDSLASHRKIHFGRTWLPGAGAFLVLLVLTYKTSLPQRSPLPFHLVFAAGGLLVLGLIGQMPLADHTTKSSGTPTDLFLRVAAICAFVVTAYGELMSASWLWVRPQPHEIQLAARILCGLATIRSDPLGSAAGSRATDLLFRLKLAEMTQEGLRLTAKGMDFVWGTIGK